MVFIASAVPAAIIGPIAGYLVDRLGPKAVACAGLLLAIASTSLLCINSMSLVGFIAVLAIVGGSTAFLLPAITADLTYVVNDTPGLGYSHAFSMFNMAYSVGSFVGPLVAGQALGHLGTQNGWFLMIGLVCGCYLACIGPAWFKLSGRRAAEQAKAAAAAV